MNAEQRTEKLHEIINDEDCVVSTGVPLRYQGETQRVPVYRIPLEYLVYNKYNGRISSSVKAFEHKNHSLDPENPDDIHIIEKFLWDSKPDRNKRTMNDIVENGQMRHGIVTADGVIIDGNRRASLLNRAYHLRDQYGFSPIQVDKCRFFSAIILPKSATPKDIQQLETMYQMGEDDKLDYNAIEKYLKCEDLKDLGFGDDEIAKMMNVQKSEVPKMMATLGLMKEYLSAFGYDEMYPLLEHMEDQFLTLTKAIKDWTDRGALAQYCNWEYTDSDIDDLKVICYDYIRSGQEGKEFRRICKPGKDGAIFQDEHIWEDFRDTHFETVDSAEDDLSVDEALEEHPDQNPVDVLQARDKAWIQKISNNFKRNLRYNVSRLDDKLDDAKPREILKKVKGLLESIDTDQDGFYGDPSVGELVRDINQITYRLKKLLKQ